MSSAQIRDLGREVSEADVAFVLAQAPADTTAAEATAALYAAAHDAAAAIAALWKVPQVSGKIRTETQRKWDDIRARSDDISRGRMEMLAQRDEAKRAPTAVSAPAPAQGALDHAATI
jgi:hypothetical protein